jgi:hypothetical protein
VEIAFRDDSSLGHGSFIRVLRGGRNFGVIFHTVGVYRFYTGNEAKLGGADLEEPDLEQLKTKVRDRYGRGGS